MSKVITNMVAERLLAATGSKDEFWSAYSRALNSFGKDIVGDALDICTHTETPQGHAAENYVAIKIIEIRQAGGPLARRITEKFNEVFGPLGLPPLSTPKPKLQVIKSDDDDGPPAA
jgi:hypothetical protein